MSSVYDVEIVQGDTYSVIVEAPDELAESLLVSVEDGSLHLDLRTVKKFRMGDSDKLTATVTLPALTAVHASGASEVASDATWSGESLEVNASGASDVALAVDVEELHTSSSGASDVRVSGTARLVRAEASGASDVDAGDLVAAVAEVSASGASDVDVHATEAITGKASGGSDVGYAGSPATVNVRTSGGGDVSAMRR